MMRQARGWVWAFAVLAAVGAALTVGVRAQEHPEHPRSDGSKKSGVEEATTMAKVTKAIKEYVEEDSRLKGGYFLVFDRQASAPLALTLDKVHEDKECMVAPKRCFVCCDFKARDGKTYDLDFFLTHAGEHWKVDEISIHKENGVPRYQWEEEKGTWKKTPVPPHGGK